MRTISSLLATLALTACSPDNSVVENQIQLDWNQGEVFYQAAATKLPNVKTETTAAPLVVGMGGDPGVDRWTQENVWVYQVVETGLTPSADDELYPYALTATDEVATISVVRAYLDAEANGDAALAESDPVVYMVFREDRDRLAALITFWFEDGVQKTRAISTTDLDKSTATLSQSMLADAPTFLAPFTARFDDADLMLEDGSELNTRLADASGDVVDTFYEDKLGGGLIVTRYERGEPWPTETVADNATSRSLTDEEVFAFRRSRHVPGSFMHREGTVPEDFDYKAALRSTVDIDSALMLDDETINGGWTTSVYDDFMPWAGAWWPLKTGKLVFGYDNKPTFSERLRETIEPLATRKDEIQAELRKMSKAGTEDATKKDALTTEYRDKHDELVTALVEFYDKIRDDLDGGTLVVRDGKLEHTVDGWSYEVNDLSPFDKFGLVEYLRGEQVSNPFYLSAWELLNQYNPGGESWWGHCNGWAAAAIATDEPLEAFDYVNGDHTISFATGDQKGLLTAAFYSQNSSFYGARYYGKDSDDIGDLSPVAFQHLVDFYIRQQGVPFVFDITAGEAVWNYPVYAVDLDVNETTAGDVASLVNINTADAATLDTLPGIGETLAKRIIEYRTTIAPFQSIEDLERVSGIGPSTFADLSKFVTIDAAQRSFAVTAKVTYQDDAVGEAFVSTSGDDTRLIKTYSYTLLADADGRVTSGTWANNNEHPDFAWVPYHNPRSRENDDSENPFMKYGSYLEVFGEDVERN